MFSRLFMFYLPPFTRSSIFILITIDIAYRIMSDIFSHISLLIS